MTSLLSSPSKVMFPVFEALTIGPGPCMLTQRRRQSILHQRLPAQLVRRSVYRDPQQHTASNEAGLQQAPHQRGCRARCAAYCTAHCLGSDGVSLLPARRCRRDMSVSLIALHSSMVMTSARERTESSWRSMLVSAGLTIVKIWSSPTALQSIIEAVPVFAGSML